MERLALDDFFRSHGLEPPAAGIETTSTVLMKSDVMQSDALTFIPRELIWCEVQARQLAALEVVCTDWTHIVGLTLRRIGSVSPAARRVAGTVRAVAAAHFGSAA